jgi:hypothetical protein
MRLTRLSFRMDYETTEEMCKAGRYNPARTVELTYKGQDVRLVVEAGRADDVWVFGSDDLLYVLTLNHGLGYCGLEVFTVDGERTAQTFVDSEEGIEHSLGKCGLDLKATTICKRLSEYLPY